MRGSTVSLPAPFQDLSALPTASVGEREPVWRVVGEKHRDEPVWFGCSGEDRFDLHHHDLHGVCYIGFSPASAILETGFRQATFTDGRIRLTPAMFRTRLLRQLETPEAYVLADSTVEESAGHGLTTELAAVTPYKLPQWWSQAIHESGPLGCSGILYEPRHHRTGRSAALHGDRGAHPWDGRSPERLTAEALRSHLVGTGVVVLDPAESSDDVTVEP